MCAAPGSSPSQAGEMPSPPATAHLPHGSLQADAVTTTVRYHDSTSFAYYAATTTTGSVPGSRAGGLWLWLPHAGVGVLILLVLFVDFLVYRRRQRLQLHRQQEKHELHEMYPKRVIGGVHRALPRPGPASQPPSPRGGPGGGGTAPALASLQLPSLQPATNSLPVLSDQAGQQKNARRKQKKILDVLAQRQKSAASTNGAAVLPASPPVECPDPASAAAGEKQKAVVPVLQKRESCRKLRPINGGRFEHGFAEKEADRLSPSLAEEAVRGDLSMA